MKIERDKFDDLSDVKKGKAGSLIFNSATQLTAKVKIEPPFTLRIVYRKKHSKLHNFWRTRHELGRWEETKYTISPTHGC